MTESCKILFKIRCRLKSEEKLLISGANHILGRWDPSKGCSLRNIYKNPNLWACTINLKKGLTYSYKYVIENYKNSNSEKIEKKKYIWENLEDFRRLKVLGSTMEVDDRFFGQIFNVMTGSRFKILWGGGLCPNTSLPKSAQNFSTNSAIETLNLLMILYRLPIKTKFEKNEWNFCWDDDALYLTSVGLRKGLKGRFNFLFIGILNYEKEIPFSDQEKISCTLLENFGCIPVFLSIETRDKFYQGFCKGVLWPSFHCVNDILNELGNTNIFDRNLWLVYCLVNRKFADTIISVYKDGDLIWIHDYHLMVLPSHLRRKLPGAKIGFFLHIPWPSSEIYRQLPIRDELLRGLLSSSLLGFHLFYYVRHFLSSCVRILNLQHESKKGVLKIEYGGRFVTIRVSHIGIDPSRFGERLSHPRVSKKVLQLKTEYKGKLIIGAIDDLDVIKGISLKLLAFEALLKNYPGYKNKILFIQVAIPKITGSRECVRTEIKYLVTKINQTYGNKIQNPVMYIERNISFEERVAIYSVSDVFFLTPIRDGLNLIPYEYIISTNEGKGQLILSEFTGCSSALSGAVRINPWNIEEVSRSLDKVLQNDPGQTKLKHAIDFKYVSEHTTKDWVESFLADLKKAPESTNRMTKLGLGLGVTFQLLESDKPSQLKFEEFFKFYEKTEKRVFLIDYDINFTDNRVKNFRSHEKSPGFINGLLEILTKDPKNIIFILSGRTRDLLHNTFKTIKHLGLVAENGFYYRCQKKKNWKNIDSTIDFSWKPIALEIMRSYTERTDGSFIEEKATSLVWHFFDSDPEFGDWQAKEMHDQLEGVLSIFGARIAHRNGRVQVSMRDVSKTRVIKRFFKFLEDDLSPDLIVFIGDETSDQNLTKLVKKKCMRSYNCSVGKNSKKEEYVFKDFDEVVSFFTFISRGSFRNSVENWFINHQENYKIKTNRVKLPDFLFVPFVGRNEKC